LINTETSSLGVLALSAQTFKSFEAGLSPMLFNSSNNYFYRPYFALSAVVGLSSIGYLSYGPNI